MRLADGAMLYYIGVWYDDYMLTVHQAAERAGRNPETIRRWIRSGRLPATRFGAQFSIEEAALDDLLRGPRADGLSADVSVELRAAMDWAVRIVNEVRVDAR